jgi:hypothetical protein
VKKEEMAMVEESRKKLAKRIVFVVLVSWMRDTEETRTVESEYATLKPRLPEGSALFLGHTGCERGEYSDAVVVLRGQLATVGDLRTWFDVGLEGTEASFVEPFEGQKLEKFLEDAQEWCARGGETCGVRIVAKRGDVETETMLDRLVVKERYRRDSKWMGELTRRMRWHQRTEKEKEQKRKEVEAQVGRYMELCLEWVGPTEKE